MTEHVAKLWYGWLVSRVYLVNFLCVCVHKWVYEHYAYGGQVSSLIILPFSEIGLEFIDLARLSAQWAPAPALGL